MKTSLYIPAMCLIWPTFNIHSYVTGFRRDKVRITIPQLKKTEKFLNSQDNLYTCHIEPCATPVPPLPYSDCHLLNYVLFILLTTVPSLRRVCIHIKCARQFFFFGVIVGQGISHTPLAINRRSTKGVGVYCKMVTGLPCVKHVFVY